MKRLFPILSVVTAVLLAYALNQALGIVQLPGVAPTERTMGGWVQVRHGSNTWTSGWAGPWANNGAGVKRNYVGLKFIINSEVHFGWARISFVVDGKGKFHGLLTGYAYETVPNQGLKAGQTKGAGENIKFMPPATIHPTIKAPTLGHLAAGAQAIAAWRAKLQ